MGKNFRFGTSKLGIIAVAAGLVKVVAQLVSGIKKSSEENSGASRSESSNKSPKQ